jgi:hypothetical protein
MGNARGGAPGVSQLVARVWQEPVAPGGVARDHLQSAQEQTKKVDLGFSDEVWVFINGKLLYVDKNIFDQPIMKTLLQLFLQRVCLETRACQMHR